MASTTQKVFHKRDKIVNFLTSVHTEPLVARITTRLHQGTPSNHPRGNEPLSHVELQPLVAKFY